MKKVSRLGQWDGPRRSSRGHASLLAGLAQRPALVRIGVVLAAIVVLTALSYCWGPPCPYRIGEVWAHDIRARVCFQVEDADKTEERREAAIKNLPPEQRDDPAIWAKVRKWVAPVMEPYHAGTVLLQRGQQITEAQRNLLTAEAQAYHSSLDFKSQVRRAVALLLLW